jgi:dTDP-4-dehydrorhamnose reductase
MHLPDSWKILVTGVTSIHGWPIYKKLQTVMPKENLLGIGPPKASFGPEVSLTAFCITDKEKLTTVRETFKPTHVIHCAGVCDLDVCEERPAWAHSLNVVGMHVIADVFRDTTPILYMSTDLVFSGNSPPSGGYTEQHEPDPVSIAGKTFALAEQHLRACKSHCIIRLGLPLGESIYGDKGAIDWIDSRFKRNLPVTLFRDEFRSCITCREIGEMAVNVLAFGLQGTYHYGGNKSWSLFEIGQYVLHRNNYPTSLLSGILRSQERNGPPRIGDVSLNSTLLKGIISANT